jgi:8-oxo-dGTP pyrophosphatase MutT (NUDIX family)
MERHHATKVNRDEANPRLAVRHAPAVRSWTRALDALVHALSRPLPGEPAQNRLSPLPRREWPAGFNPASVRRAAGLLLMFPLHELAHIVLTVRAGALGRHGGQVSMPGGVVEPGETLEQAALREANEEIGLDLEHVRPLGALTPLDIPVSGFRLHPIVAAIRYRPSLRPSDGEVECILEVAIDHLMDPASFVSRTRMRDRHALIVPAFDVAGYELWGATAMVLSEFLTMLGWQPGDATRK